jgi:hypothetical protein
VPRVKQRSQRLSSLLFTGALALNACTGYVRGEAEPFEGTPSSPNGGSGNPPAGAAPPTSLPKASACRTSSPGPRSLRRLTSREYAATLQDLFNDPAVPLTSVLSDPPVLGFTVDTRALVIEGLGAQQLMDQAESVAAWAVTTHLGSLSSCSTNDAGCRQSFIKAFGKRVHRAPLTDAEVAQYEKLFSAEASFNDGAQAVIAAMLQSPYFLYRRELGQQSGGSYQLSGHELASALSYLLTGSMPDEALMAAADSGALAQPAELDRQAERLLQTPRGHQAVARFMRDWLDLSKLDTVAKDDTVFKLSDSLRKAMGEETARVIDDAVFTKNSTFLSLLSSPSSFVNRELATHYGLDDAGSFGDQLMPVTFAPGKRDGGLLAQGSLLTALATSSESSPVQRGKMVRTRLLCQELPPPPPQLDTALKPPSGSVTTREHFAAHAQNPVCASCHRRMDPIGFGFEHYDAFGRRREQDNGHPVDASGSVVLEDGTEVPFDGLPGLTNYLTTQVGDSVNACLVRYWAYFAFGSAGWAEDQCTYDSMTEQAKLEGFSMKAVVKAVLKTARFSRRVADP